MPDLPPRCLAPHPFVPAILCGLGIGHDGDHAGRAYWTTTRDEGPPTVRLPPIRETVRRRPPGPDVRELSGPDLLRALAAELLREADQTGELPALLLDGDDDQ